MIRWVLAAGLLLSACAAPEQTQRDLDRVARDGEQQAITQGMQQGNQADTCGKAAYAQYIGRPASEIDQTHMPPHARIIRPGMMITQDFSPQRLNIRVAPDGKVTEIGCF
ncbi:MAG: I78 family peptidase inhibitor [Pseudomonadota bacterium]